MNIIIKTDNACLYSVQKRLSSKVDFLIIKTLKKNFQLIYMDMKNMVINTERGTQIQNV